MHLGIITPYAAQVAEIKQIFIEKGIPRNFTHPLEFSTVDGFQGREKDIIFISCVRTGIAQQFFFLYFMLLTLYFKAGLGFLTDDRRLNVALTRAKYAVVVIGKDDLLARDKMWKAVMDYAKSKGSYVKSSINTGKRSSYEGRAPPPPGKVVNRDGQFFRRDDLERNAA